MKVYGWLLPALGLLAALALAGCGAPSDVASGLDETVTAMVGVEQAGPLAEYRLELTLDPAARRLTGRQQVTFPNTTARALEEIVFRLYPNLPQYGGRLEVASVWVDGEGIAPTLRANNTALAIPLAAPLAPGASADVSLTFEVQIPEREAGYVLFGHSQGVWSLPDAYPLLAVHDGKTWREDIAPAHGDAVFAAAGLYEVSLTLPSTLTLVATGSIVQAPDAGDARTYQIRGGPLREFAWLASADYRVKEITTQGVRVRSHYLLGDDAAGEAALHTAAAALRVYSEAFGPYPFPVMDVVEAPLEYYGMEYPGLNLIGLDLYRSRRNQLEDRVVHEIAHQWWYAQVGNDPVNVPWLDEGLAEYSMATYYVAVYGQARANTLINQRWLVPYLTAVDEGRDTVVNRPSASFGPEYEIMVYGKAALFFDALRQELGTEGYLSVLRAYVERYRWRIATPGDFLNVAEEVSGQELDRMYNHWILSSQ